MGIKAFFERLFGRTKNYGYVSESGNGVYTNGNGQADGTRLVCVECKSGFLFETGEQKFYKMRGLTPPKRCPSCRTRRKRRHRR